jgi:hypothetical protein
MSQRSADDHDAGPQVPPADVLEAMRCHAQEVHGKALVPKRDVQGLATKPDKVWLHWQPQSFAGPARYTCARCRGVVFAVGDPPYGDPQRNAYLLRNSRMLQELTAGLDTAQREAFIEEWDRGEVGHAVANTVAARAAMRTKRPGEAPYLERRARCQEALLAHVERGLTVEEAVGELENLHKTDPEEHRRIFGGERTYVAGTIKGHWKRIPIVERNAARARGRARPVKDRNAERAKRRKGKLTP